MLLDDIIAILSDENGSLNGALLKTKVLLHSIGKKDLATWVTNELKGYPDEQSIPEYRIVSAEVRCNTASYTWQQTGVLLPLGHLTEDQRRSFTVSRCVMSISSIEAAANKRLENTQHKLIRSLPPEFTHLFDEVTPEGVNILSLWCEFNMIEIAAILTEVRSRLLDFALELRDVVGIETPEADLANKVANVDTAKMFGTSIFGDGNTIIIGSQNVQAITNQKDDIEGLIGAIGQLGFQQAQLTELREAVAEDQAAGKVPDVSEGKTGTWFGKALKEAGKGVVKAGVDVVSAVIVKALKAYTIGTP
jgi:hypothetical protein